MDIIHLGGAIKSESKLLASRKERDVPTSFSVMFN